MQTVSVEVVAPGRGGACYRQRPRGGLQLIVPESVAAYQSFGNNAPHLLRATLRLRRERPRRASPRSWRRPGAYFHDKSPLRAGVLLLQRLHRTARLQPDDRHGGERVLPAVHGNLALHRQAIRVQHGDQQPHPAPPPEFADIEVRGTLEPAVPRHGGRGMRRLVPSAASCPACCCRFSCPSCCGRRSPDR